jgi:uncharacterized PurR-regulated membrane protein YhhQ (DUF165 family)
MKWYLALAYVGLAVLANWLAAKWTVPVGFGLLAPAGVWAIAFVLVIRDWLNQLSAKLSVALIPVASILSYGVAEAAGWSGLQKIAIASVAAFCLSELVEFCVFAPIRKHKFTLGVALSGSVGLVLDSYVFLAIAFGSLAFMDGQLVGKAEALLAGVAITFWRRKQIPVAAVVTA